MESNRPGHRSLREARIRPARGPACRRDSAHRFFCGHWTAPPSCMSSALQSAEVRNDIAHVRPRGSWQWSRLRTEQAQHHLVASPPGVLPALTASEARVPARVYMSYICLVCGSYFLEQVFTYPRTTSSRTATAPLTRRGRREDRSIDLERNARLAVVRYRSARISSLITILTIDLIGSGISLVGPPNLSPWLRNGGRI